MPPAPQTLPAQIAAAAADRGDKPFLEFEGEITTYGQLDDITGRVANGLLGLGMTPGQHVGLFMGNRTEFVLSWFGASRAGMPVIPVNAGLVGDGMAHIVNHSDATTMIVEEELLDTFMAVRPKLTNVQNVVVVGKRGEIPDGALPWSTLSEADKGAPDVDVKPTDIMMLMYTSGTTGLPKGIVIPQGRFGGGAFVLRAAGVTEEDQPYTCLPLFHGNAAFISLSGAFGMGLKLALGRKFSASRFWDEVRRYNATTFNSLGAMMTIIWKQAPKPDDKDNPVRLVISAACPKEIWRGFEERFGVSIVEFYGTVEGGLTMAGPDAPVGSIGKPVLGNEIQIIDEDGNECGPNEIGELVCRPSAGPAQVTYYKNKDASEKKTAGGWLHTGDRAYKDDNGYLWYVDRADHFMRRRGENISSTEVESVVEQHDGVLECAAFGVPSELGEDDVMIAVKAQPGATLDPAELIAFCEARMAAFQIPRYVRVMDELPKTETHRVQKLKLRDEGVTADTFDREQSA